MGWGAESGQQNFERSHIIRVLLDGFSLILNKPYIFCFTIATMLEDLDFLSERLKKLVEQTQQLVADRQALHARLTRAESEREALATKLAQEGQQTQILSAQVRSYESEMQALRSHNSAQSEALQGSLDLFKQEKISLQAQLQSRDHDVIALRAATIQAKERIDAVLERLPGGQLKEQN